VIGQKAVLDLKTGRRGAAPAEKS